MGISGPLPSVKEAANVNIKQLKSFYFKVLFYQFQLYHCFYFLFQFPISTISASISILSV